MTTASFETTGGLASSPTGGGAWQQDEQVCLGQKETELKAKAEQKEKVVQNIISNIESAIKNNRDKDRLWLQNVLDPGDECFRTLVRLVIEPKYYAYPRLRCKALKAIQMLLRVALQMVPEELEANPNVGARCFEELASTELSAEAFPVMVAAAKSQEDSNLSFFALWVLAELGPNALSEATLTRTMELFVEVPDKGAELLEVALRFHAHGGPQLRESLLRAVLEHPGGRGLCEVLLQVVNKGDDQRRLRGVKVLSGCLALPAGGSLLYTNDAFVLVEILLRDIPNSAGDAAEFACYGELLKALYAFCPAARGHRRREVLDMLEDLRDDDRNLERVRLACSEVLAVIEQTPAT